MLGSEVLDVGIGLILIYLLLSVMASAMNEAIESLIKMRAVNLELGIRELLHDPALAKQIYGHPLICGLYRGKYRSGARNLPSYLPPSSFALALLDLVARGPVSESAAPAAAGGGDADARLPAATPSPISIDAVRRNLSTVPPPVRRVLEIALDAAEGDLARLQASVEAWFNSSMDRVSGWYKRHAGRCILVIGAFLTVALNVNTVTLARYLSHERGARDVLVQRAGAVARDTTILQQRNFGAVSDSLRSLALPIGWGSTPSPSPLTLFGGWLATILAISLGAPFWFDMLNKVVAVRSAVKSDSKPKGDSADDASPPPTSAIQLPSGPAVGAAAAFEPHEWATGDAQEGRI